MSAPLLQVRDLRVTFSTPDGPLQAVRGVDLDLLPGTVMGVVGESGSGKSVTMLTVIGLTQGAQVSGQALFEGRDLLSLPAAELRRIRGARIAMVFQDPLSSLHPHYRVGWQIVEMIRAHQPASRAEARRRAIELLAMVGIPQPERRVDDYPHQFSGGMRQRVMIAMALALRPRLLIADEPTTALDVTVQSQILDLLRRLQAELGMAVIIVTHDLGVIAEMAHRVLVMYAGQVVERAPRRTLYYRPHHPYTRGLLESLPARAGPRGGPGPGHGGRGRLTPIPGQPPSLIQVPSGCPFHPRCPFTMEICRREPPPLRPVDAGEEHESACWLPPEVVGLGAEADGRRRAAAEAGRVRAGEGRWRPG
ncbi:MAG TPA: ABC transporter ATP-binding protein [Candidatus Dormibacteraeota bacterium]|jgi:oligopeptide/dipeptide ABC transporter ATP-binding protein|nr:ABC transporter ATP-binding protein [Candidatus Dormibacteraeota bacterium]